MSSAPKSDLLAGTLKMLVLRTLSVQSMHGYVNSQHIAKLSDDVLKVEAGSLSRVGASSQQGTCQGEVGRVANRTLGKLCTGDPHDRCG